MAIGALQGRPLAMRPAAGRSRPRGFGARAGLQPAGQRPSRARATSPDGLRRAPRATAEALGSKLLPLEEELTRDEAKEAARVYQRTLSTFTFERWASHRSTRRYVRHMASLLQSGVVRGLAQPLAYVAGISTVCCMYEDLLQDGTLPSWLPTLQLPTIPYELTSFALSLLLVFRTNTSYDRWLDVNTTWAGIGNRARDTMRQLISHLSDTSGASPLSAAMCRWVVAYCRSLKAELTEGSDLRRELDGILTPPELEQLLGSHHPPSFALSMVTELGAAAPLRESHRIRLDENLTFFEDAVGTCERILRTPIPLGYTRHSSRFMVIWLSSLPFCLYSTAGWGTIPLAVVISFLLLGIEEIGVQIEEPFGILPLDDMCEEIEGDLFSMLREAPLAKRTAQATAAAALGLPLASAGDAPLFSPLSRPGPRMVGGGGGGGGGGAASGGSAHKQWTEDRGGASGGADPDIFHSLDDDGSSQWEGF